MTPSKRARAMTLLEVLLAIALLSLLSAGTLWLVTLATREAPALSDQLRWQACAERTLDLITDALLIGDGSAGTPNKVQMNDDTLLIDSRLANVARQTVSSRLSVTLDRTTHELQLSTTSETSAQASRASILLGDVIDWTVYIDQPNRTLSVKLSHPLGWTVQRSGRW